MSDLFDTPRVLPFQKHRETSKDAARKNITAKGYRERAYELVRDSAQHGRTIDEVDERIGVPTARIGTRIKELCDKGHLICTTQTRKTRCNREANVYVHKDCWLEGMGKAAEKAKPLDIVQLEAEHTRMKAALENIAYMKSWHLRNSPDLIVKTAMEGLGK